MPTNRRVFWSNEEKSAVLAAAHDLRKRQPQLTLKEIGAKAQGAVAKNRRRPVNNKLTSWLSAELKGSGPKPAAEPRAKPVKRAPVARAATNGTPAQSNVLQTLIEQGAAILSGILRHPSVRDAIGGRSRSRASRKR